MCKTLEKLRTSFQKCKQESPPSRDFYGSAKFLKHVCQAMARLRKEQVAAATFLGDTLVIATNQIDTGTFKELELFLRSVAIYALSEDIRLSVKFPFSKPEIDIESRTLVVQHTIKKSVAPLLANITSGIDTRKYSASGYGVSTREAVAQMLGTKKFKEVKKLSIFSSAYSILESLAMDIVASKERARRLYRCNMVYVDPFYSEWNCDSSLRNSIHCEMKILDYVLLFAGHEIDELGYVSNTKFCCRQCYFVMKYVERLCKRSLVAGGHNVFFPKNWSFPLFIFESDLLCKKLLLEATGGDKEVEKELADKETLAEIRKELPTIFDEAGELEEYEQEFPLSPKLVLEDLEESVFEEPEKGSKKRKRIGSQSIDTLFSEWSSAKEPTKRKKAKVRKKKEKDPDWKPL